ncbi:hypothetical protein CDL15_Pgr020707 [Punica granatum]|uniref:Uncharacterized protein n=1 Tax=Punica granatum TaxID=22663 RepID=A0A218VUN1_PUNGR|nr:hypothetical protein CDL15_Pgr020707 [Punica granatum]
MSLISPYVVGTSVRATQRLESRFCPVRTFGVELNAPGPRLLFVPFNIRFGDPFASREIVGSSSPIGDRLPGKT